MTVLAHEKNGDRTTEDVRRIEMARRSEEVSQDFDTTGFDFDIAGGPFRPRPDGFAEHYACPDWFRDAKFGIYSHWGVATVPGFDGHYARFMYSQEEPQAYRDDQTVKRRPMSGYKPGREAVYDYHVRKFGHPTEFGFKDFVPMWKAEKFDPMALTEFFRECGARYYAVMAVHHDNFDNFDSAHHSWNSVKMGPKRDIVGEWKEACAAHGLRFAVTTHLSNQAHEHLFYQGGADTRGPLKAAPYDTMDPAYADLYGDRTPDRLRVRNPHYARQWYRRLKDLIDKYDPDLLYLDGGLPNGDYGLHLAAHYYNRNIQRHGGRLDGVFTIKRATPEGFTLDMERRGLDAIREHAWQTDTSMNPGWFYLGREMVAGEMPDGTGMGGQISDQHTDVLLLDANKVIDNLIDIVSKNGNMLLNVGLRADGSLPETFRAELAKIGDWLEINGEGIYGTRPYTVYGEGPFRMPEGGPAFNDNQYEFGAEDIRFTTRGNTLYAYLLGYPDSRQTRIKSLSLEHTGGQTVRSVTMLGSGEELAFEHTTAGLVVSLPQSPPSDYAHGLRIEGLHLEERKQ